MQELTIHTTQQLQVIDITDQIKNTLGGLTNGLLTVYVPHTTAAITIQEPDKELWEDLLTTYKKLVPLKANYKHNAKYSGMSGEQNAHAHILASLIKPSIHIPIENGEIALGTWQNILFIELDGGRHRNIRIQTISK